MPFATAIDGWLTGPAPARLPDGWVCVRVRRRFAARLDGSVDPIRENLGLLDAQGAPLLEGEECALQAGAAAMVIEAGFAEPIE